MKYKPISNIKNTNPYDLSKISYRCVVCGGKKRLPTSYGMNGYKKYCHCKK